MVPECNGCKLVLWACLAYVVWFWNVWTMVEAILVLAGGCLGLADILLAGGTKSKHANTLSSYLLCPATVQRDVLLDFFLFFSFRSLRRVTAF